MSRLAHQQIISTTKRWISDFVIKLSLCPFAHVGFEADSIHYAVSDNWQHRSMLEDVWSAGQRLVADDTVSDCFVIFPARVTFSYLLQLQSIYNSLLQETSTDEYVQTVVFHPEFLFEGEEHHHAGNYVNRSPHPMIHLLRVSLVAEATATLPDELSIPLANQKKLAVMGSDELAMQLQNYDL